eukprot:481539-Hanusia_phi.AAC.2
MASSSGPTRRGEKPNSEPADSRDSGSAKLQESRSRPLISGTQGIIVTVLPPLRTLAFVVHCQEPQEPPARAACFRPAWQPGPLSPTEPATRDPSAGFLRRPQAGTGRDTGPSSAATRGEVIKPGSTS